MLNFTVATVSTKVVVFVGHQSPSLSVRFCITCSLSFNLKWKRSSLFCTVYFWRGIYNGLTVS